MASQRSKLSCRLAIRRSRIWSFSRLELVFTVPDCARRPKAQPRRRRILDLVLVGRTAPRLGRLGLADQLRGACNDGVAYAILTEHDRKELEAGRKLRTSRR